MHVSRAATAMVALLCAPLGACGLYFGDDAASDVDAPVILPDARAIDAPAIDAPPPIDAVPVDAPIDAIPVDSPHTAPTVDITSPAMGVLVADHAPVLVHAVITGNPIASVAFEVDGAIDTGTSLPPVPADCFAGCAVDVAWNTASLREGNHTARLIATDDVGQMASDSVTLLFQDAPELRWVRPQADMHGAHVVTIEVSVTDRGPNPISTVLTIDGGAPQPRSSPDCLTGCSVIWTWDTTAVSAGTHMLRVTSTDGAGRTTTSQMNVAIGDIPYVSQISVTGESDGVGSLEVEVHLYDAGSGAWLGCTGQTQGMQNVDVSDVLYTNLTGYFVDGTNTPLGTDRIGNRNLVVRVTEDDELPCPTPYGGLDDLIGTSPSTPASSLPTLSTSFGRATQLTTRTGRPFAR